MARSWVPAHVAMLTFWDPWEAPHGGTLRTRALCRAFARLGARVSCVFPRSRTSAAGTIDGITRVPVDQQTVGHRAWPPALQRLKRQLLPLPTTLGARSEQIRDALRDLTGVELLVVSHLSAVQYHDAVPGARLWLDQSDLWSDVATREAGSRRGLARATTALQRRGLIRAEDEAVRRAAVVSAAGWADRTRLATRTGAAVTWLPTPVEVTPLPPRDRGDEPAAAGFLANFAYHPNRDALDLLVERWLPRLRERGWRLVVAGLGSRDLSLPDGVEALGAVPSVRDLYERVDATVAPVRLGGGMKVKVVESLLAGRPVIATAFALEGFPPELRALATEVDAEEPAVPDAGSLDALAPPVPDELRHRFSMDGFTDGVAMALRSDRLGGSERAS